MPFPRPTISFKCLLCIGILCALIQPGARQAFAHESPDALTIAQPVAPPADAPSPDAPAAGHPLFPPAGMSVEEFTQHMQGAHEAALTLDGFAALKQTAPDLIVLDVRSKQSFDMRHMQGALNMPVTEMTEHTLPALIPDKTRTVVLVCDESFAPTRRISMTLQAWPVLRANGYTSLYRLNLWRPDKEGEPMHTPAQIGEQVQFSGSDVP